MNIEIIYTLPVNFRAFLKLLCMQEHPILSIGPLKSYFLFGKIQYEGKPAGNMVRYTRSERGVAERFGQTKLDHGSSEAIREAYIKDNLFKYWFIGFLEGKGSFIIDGKGNLEFKIVHRSTDASVLFYIKKKLGFGVVRIQDKIKGNHCFKVNDENGLLKLISILNGNLFLHIKKEEFKLLIKGYNQKYGTDIVYLTAGGYTFCPIKYQLPILSKRPHCEGAAWLSGFTDAVGSFSCIIKDKPDKSGLVKLSYTLRQRGNFDLMKHLAEILKGKIHDINGIYETTVHITKLSKVIHYLSLYPLKTKKSIIFFNIKKIYLLVKNKKSLTSEELKLLTRYNRNLNRLSYQV